MHIAGVTMHVPVLGWCYGGLEGISTRCTYMINPQISNIQTFIIVSAVLHNAVIQKERDN
jgi:hypothetical protein